MTAEIISIGDELLIGQVVNTNASWMAEKLNMAGIKVNCILAISDEKEQILDTIKIASKRSDIVLVTGGLGPTKDDITKKTLLTITNSKLVFNNIYWIASVCIILLGAFMEYRSFRRHPAIHVW